MHFSELLRAKAMSKSEESDAIVVSFGAESYQPLLDRRFRAVIRKRVPKTLRPKWIYVHINAPISAICARAEVLRIEQLQLKQVVEMARDLDMSSREIASYVSADAEVGCYFLGKIEFPREPITVSKTSEVMVYHAPQSFFVLSVAAKREIDRMGKFSARLRRPRKR